MRMWGFLRIFDIRIRKIVSPNTINVFYGLCHENFGRRKMEKNGSMIKILVEKWDKILFIKFNNLPKKNCINIETYNKIAEVLRSVVNDESITLVVFTGVGEYFSAGNDLTIQKNVEDMDSHLKKNNFIFKDMIKAFVECPKVLIALVNGPAIGIGATIAGLCDVVWCEEEAYFLMPFTKLGIVPEGCSSYILPLVIGRSRANEMLLFSEKMSSKEALQSNFASRLFKLAEFESVILPKLKQLSELPPQSMHAAKALMRMHDKEALYKALNAECDELIRRFSSEEFVNALIAFSMRRKDKSKL